MLWLSLTNSIRQQDPNIYSNTRVHCLEFHRDCLFIIRFFSFVQVSHQKIPWCPIGLLCPPPVKATWPLFPMHYWIQFRLWRKCQIDFCHISLHFRPSVIFLLCFCYFQSCQSISLVKTAEQIKVENGILILEMLCFPSFGQRGEKGLVRVSRLKGVKGPRRLRRSGYMWWQR